MDQKSNPENQPESTPQPLSTQKEHELKRFQFDTHPVSEKFGCLHDLFEAQVRIRPDALALVCGDTTLTYGELDARANQLARYLKLRGAGPGKFVGLFFERSIHPIIALLGCLKSGAAYLPIDPSYPHDRIEHIMTESEAVLMLTESALLERAIGAFKGITIALDAIADELALRPSGRLTRGESGVSPSDLCYVIYTSGTTGRPKGVMAEHRHAHQYTLSFNEVCGTTPEDRIYQGFSLSFDGSVEEIWMAFSNGSTLVVGDKDTPKFGNELGQYLQKHGVTYFSTVPTMLSTITEPIATLKCLVVSGEVCPPELVARWATNTLRMLNVYGPTEGTVNTTAAECVVGQAVTIGKPLPGYGIHILDSEFREVADGEKGELFVSGVTLARGYLKQPELTAERFMVLENIIANKPLRVYRTGDLVRRNEQGDLEFFGRIDSQVKIRGYRVELAEIESILLLCPNIKTAAVKLIERDGISEIAAYVILNDPALELDRDAVLTNLSARVPAYMVPGFLDVLTELPRLTSGKVDRKLLPDPVNALVSARKEIIEPQSERELQVAEIWKKIFGLSRISIDDDFFLELGGHSLVAAKMATLLRSATGRAMTVRDAYKYSTIRSLALALGQMTLLDGAGDNSKLASEKSKSELHFEAHSRTQRLIVQALQLLFTLFIYALGSTPVGILFFSSLEFVKGAFTLAAYLKVTLGLTLLTWPAFALVAILGKWLIIGRFKAGRYPLWSFYFLRWWMVGRLQSLSGAGALTGTPVLSLYYRLMGARVGKHCILDTAAVSAWDLVQIGENTAIGSDTLILGSKVEDGMLILGQVEIGSGCFVGIHSSLGLRTRLEDGARLDDQSLLPDDATIGLGESYRGSPAQKAFVRLSCEAVSHVSKKRRPILFGLIHLALLEALGLLLIGPALPIIFFIKTAFDTGGRSGLAVALVLSVPLSVVLYALYFVALKKLILRKATPGTYSIESGFYLRKLASDKLMKASRSLLMPLYTTIYFPTWLRMLGSKIGPRAELSTVWNFAPELIDVGPESFFADGSIIGGKRFFNGTFEINVNKIGKRSFVGNSAILPVGYSLGDSCLLGVQSIPPQSNEQSSCTPDGTEWLGSPSFSLPNRPKVGHFDSSVTFKPTLKLYFERAVIDGLRISIPGYIGLSSAVGLAVGLNYFLNRFGFAGLIFGGPVLSLGLSLYAIGCVVILKRVVMGTFKPVITPLWSMYVWLNEMINGAYEAVMAPLLSPFLGTVLAAPLLRLIGIRIGRNTYIETTLFSEFDLVEIGNFAALNSGAIIQNHLFEDRVMKSSNLKIGDGCSIGSSAVVLYDTEMQRGASLGALSLLMKGETLAAHSRSHGIPTVSVTGPEASSPRQDLRKALTRKRRTLGFAASLGITFTKLFR